MGKEQFFYSETQPLFKKLEQLTQRSGVSRGQAFEDFLTAIVCALAAETKEAEYLAMIERHKRGNAGKRGADLLAQMFADLLSAMTKSDADTTACGECNHAFAEQHTVTPTREFVISEKDDSVMDLANVQEATSCHTTIQVRVMMRVVSM